MNLKKELLGIVLAFSTVGVIATGADANAYDTVYKQHEKQEKMINNAIESEFISQEDQALLSERLEYFDQEKTKKTRRQLKGIIKKDSHHLEKIEDRLLEKEKRVARAEFKQLKKTSDLLEKKGQEDFVVALDRGHIKEAIEEVDRLSDSSKVGPIRDLSKEINHLNQTVKLNQEAMVELVKDLEKSNNTSEELLKNKFVSEEEKSKLKADQKTNQELLKNLNSVDDTRDKREETYQLIETIQKKKELATEDFKGYEKKTKELATSMDTLLSDGLLTDEETKTLKTNHQKINEKLKLKGYDPGDLGENYHQWDESYTNALKSSDAKKEEKRKQEEAKKEQQRAEEARIAKEQAEEVARNTPGEPQLVGSWYQAPHGFKFIKWESGKTYGQVKNPGNFGLITVAEASNYSPGHGNGSAKQ